MPEDYFHSLAPARGLGVCSTEGVHMCVPGSWVSVRSLGICVMECELGENDVREPERIDWVTKTFLCVCACMHVHVHTHECVRERTQKGTSQQTWAEKKRMGKIIKPETNRQATRQIRTQYSLAWWGSGKMILFSQMFCTKNVFLKVVASPWIWSITKGVGQTWGMDFYLNLGPIMD